MEEDNRYHRWMRSCYYRDAHPLVCIVHSMQDVAVVRRQHAIQRATQRFPGHCRVGHKSLNVFSPHSFRIEFRRFVLGVDRIYIYIYYSLSRDGSHSMACECVCVCVTVTILWYVF